MAKVLYITANPNDASHSYSMAVGKEFIESYKVVNPTDEIIEIDLYEQYIPLLDSDVFKGWGKLSSGINFEQLSEKEQTKVKRLAELSDQFIVADKYVFVTPFWNFSYPPMMKAYLDSVSVAGKSFKYSAEGQPIGLLTDKKALHIQARGGNYSDSPAAEFEMGHRHLQVMMKFFGIPSFEGLFVEGHNKNKEKAQDIKENAIARAKDLAHNF
ncbi:FMN-dependent NADH-azoreductase [Paenibacillus qinlingensis]|uniref:FMN dependent NADH:quinone oxidoreductase n=1 Tax=Paenibacillus qinlingensis TaxID=1837343 RepID=A0ABU1NU51_9BACL|nr:FMN-dependent NADH-azoreductase [Paenibacillus qinlingensis]MDR6551004.1 FMN-dependent NADH-azoreductase [Paenibacillus qinlingensis]